MLSQATIDSIATQLGLDAKELATGINDEKEINIEIPTGTRFTDGELATMKDNLSKEGYDRGAPAGREMLIKDMNKALGFEGEDMIKDYNQLLSAYKVNILEEAKVKPNEKITSLETSIQNLQKLVEEKDTDYMKLQGEYNQKTQFNSVSDFIPELPEGLGLTRAEVTEIFFKTHELTDEGIKQGGKILKDSTENAISTKDAVGSFLSARGWETKVTGRGGGAGDAGTGKPTTMDDYQATLDAKGISAGSVEANAILSDMIKENPDLGDE